RGGGARSTKGSPSRSRGAECVPRPSPGRRGDSSQWWDRASSRRSRQREDRRANGLPTMASSLHPSRDMQLDQLIDRCRRLEERAAALYRSYAESAANRPSFRALWTALASEEAEHAHEIALARSKLEPTAGWQTRLDGWEE